MHVILCHVLESLVDSPYICVELMEDALLLVRAVWCPNSIRHILVQSNIAGLDIDAARRL
jgi:hypothetical protein